MKTAWKSIDERDEVSICIKKHDCPSCDHNNHCPILDNAIMYHPGEWVIVYNTRKPLRGVCKNKLISA
jgi:hypothetical protein